MAAVTARGWERWRRMERRGELRRRGIVPNRVQRVYRVDVMGWAIPPWARERAMKELSQGVTHVWMTRMAARNLEREAVAAKAQVRVTETEYRHCTVCGRVLLGEDAAARRAVNESCRTGRQIPCGDDCLARARKTKRGPQ